MAAKPSVIPTWATSGSITTPSAAKIAAGWVTAEKPPAQFLNWLSKNAGDWFTWLDDVVLSDSGTALVWRSTKTHEFASDVKFSGSNKKVKIISTGTAALEIGPDGSPNFKVLVSGATTISAGGLLISAGGIEVTGTTTFHTLVTVTAAISASGDITSTAGNINASGGYVKTTESDIRHAARTSWVPVTMMLQDAATADWNMGESADGAFLYPDQASAKLYVQLPVLGGSRLTEVHAYLYDNTGDTLTFRVFKQDLTNGATPGTPVQLGANQTTVGATTNVQKLAVTGLTEAVGDAGSVQYYAIISTNAISPSNNQRFYALKFVYDRL